MQSDIFAPQHNSSAHAELCNALYEREIGTLVYSDDDASRLRRKLKSLPYYVKLAGWRLLDAQTPLELDTQNASWQVKQSLHPPKFTDPERLAAWLDRYSAPGLPIPLWQEDGDAVQVLLDTVDRVDYSQQRLHLNRWGWCSFSGTSLDQEPIHLLKPSKAVMSAACGGHRWNHQGRIAPRLLGLRELLLTSLIHWSDYTRAALVRER